MFILRTKNLKEKNYCLGARVLGLLLLLLLTGHGLLQFIKRKHIYIYSFSLIIKK